MTDQPSLQAPILVFDSGVGGLSVLVAIRRRLPTAPLIFCMDNAAYPYGQRSEEELTTRVPALLGRLVERHQPRLVVIACNTASTIALPTVRDVLDLPVVGTVPAIKPAALMSRSRVIGVLGTTVTVRQAYVDDLARQFASDCRVLRAGAPALVDYAEKRLRGAACNPAVARASLALLGDQPGGDAMDTVVLACTHFPLVQDDLAAAAPSQLAFVDGADGIARRVQALLAGHHFPESPPAGTTITTGAADTSPALIAGLQAYGLTAPVVL